MNRLQKKCFVAATGFHLLLLVILFVGPAFLSSADKPDSLPLLDFVPMKTIDAALSGGGSPTAKPPLPAPQPQPPAPQPQVAPPAPQSQPQSVKEIVRPPEPSLEPVEKKPRMPQVSTKLVTRSRTTSSSPDADVDARATAKRREIFNRTLHNLREGLSSGTTVEIYGPGGGGPTYADFFQAVKTVYANAWAGTVPDGATDANTFVKVKVTIARDGTVVSARIVQASGKPLVDKSVQSLLERVKKAAPIPEGSKDSERTVEITLRVNTPALAG
ncbi:MAG: TonB C-terminal domain-containing protein [Verrucomicrobia bacterium]|jgi:TonB family protein|nr:TonB C-terminal domain-containing protein [Verrucomicrobiota bacterium]